jgi:hypothetical protein
VFCLRRESPWKVDGDSAGVSSKLKLLEQELINLDKVSKDFPSKVSSSIKKQAKRYQSLSEKIDDLCRRIVSNSFLIAFVYRLCYHANCSYLKTIVPLQTCLY